MPPHPSVQAGASRTVTPARLLIPAIRADAAGSFEAQWPSIEAALTLEVGGFILFGGSADSVRRLVTRLRASSAHPLLIGSDLERGAGQQFSGATSLPPPAALAAIDDPEAAFEAGRITAAEATSLGVNWVLAPVADLDIEPENPIVSTRAFGSNPERVATLVTAWVEGCRTGGAIACLKHFPGHGRTTADSHVERPIVGASARTLRSTDLVPFATAFAAGAASTMTAHVSYPALDPTGEVATLSSPIIEGLLRGDLGYDGLVVSDALGMAGISGTMGEGEAAVRALRAGCDLLLYPEEPGVVVASLHEAMAAERLDSERIARSMERIERALRALPIADDEGVELSAANRQWADEAALRSLVVLRGSPRLAPGAGLVEFDDDLGGPHPAPSRAEFASLLSEDRIGEANDWPPLVAIYSDPRAWKGRAGLSREVLEQARSCLNSRPDATLVLFGHPRLLEQIGGPRHVLCAWGGEPLMQRAAARWLLSRGAS